MVTIPESHHDLLKSPIHVTMATTMPDNMPQTTVLWFKWDGENVLISTTKERQKTENLEDNPQASLMFVDPDNIYKYLELRGTVEIIEEGAYKLIDELAKMYTGNEEYYGNLAPLENKDKETRIILKFTPTDKVARG